MSLSGESTPGSAKRGYSGEASSKRRLIWILERNGAAPVGPVGNSDAVRLELNYSDSERKLRRVASSIPWATGSEDAKEQESP
jgi:hypothetical protein